MYVQGVSISPSINQSNIEFLVLPHFIIKIQTQGAVFFL